MEGGCLHACPSSVAGLAWEGMAVKQAHHAHPSLSALTLLTSTVSPLSLFDIILSCACVMACMLGGGRGGSVLTVADPNAPTNLVAYSYKDREFKTIPPGPLDNIVFHFSMDGSALHVVRRAWS